MARREFSVAVRKARLAHANGKCEGCGLPLVKGRFQYDHDKPDGLGGEPTFENCRVLCSGSATSCHAIKTEADKALMQKADNVKHFHEGTRARPKVKIKCRPKEERPPRRLAESLPPLQPRRMFR